MENDITINLLQHYIHCQRQWGIIAIEGQWIDNFKTVQGDILHEKVDNFFIKDQRKGTVTVRSLPVFHDELGMHGIADCVEFIPNKEGSFIPQLGDYFSIHVIEYKNGKPNAENKPKYSDSIQVAAQMLCINQMFQTKCTGCLFYNAIKRRVQLENAEILFEEVKNILILMREMLEAKIMPPKPLNQNCNHCSLADICMPKTTVSCSQKNRLQKCWEAENEEIT